MFPTTLPDPRPHVLVMDADRTLLLVVTELLEWEGFRVTTSPTLLDPAAIGAIGPDVVLLDIARQHASDSWALLARLRIDPATCRLPVVVWTALWVDWEWRAFLTARNVPLLRKPVNAGDLAEALRSVCPTAPVVPLGASPDRWADA